MTQLLQMRRTEDLAEGLRGLSTCDIPVVAPHRTERRGTGNQVCRPTGRSPETHRRGGVEQAKTAANVRMRTSKVSNDPAFVRRRAWAVGILAGIVLAGVVAFFTVVGNDYQDAAAGTPTATHVVHVQSGESLSALAQRVAPGHSVATVIEAVRELNDLQTVGLRPGQALVVPDYR